MLFIIFLFGLIIGSFLNVVVYRVNHDDSPLRGRSYCPSCKHILSWFDLIPIFSFLFLGGKCRYCRKPISWQYIFVEIISGINAVFLWIYLSSNGKRILGLFEIDLLLFFQYLALLLVFSCFLIIFFSDWLYMTVPFSAVIGGIIGVTLYLFLSTPPPYWDHVISASIGFSFFLFLKIVTKGKGMGFGDALITLNTGLLLGLEKNFLALYVSFLTGAVWGVILILIKKKRFGQKIAFGPFLILGAVVVFFKGEQLWSVLRKIIFPDLL